MRLNALLIALAALVCTGCFSSQSSSPESTPSPVTSVATESIFPHNAGWKDPTQHGLYVKNSLNMDYSSCLGCHNDTNASDGAPTCHTSGCHTVFPHTDTGVTAEAHGAYVVKFGKNVCASQCHGTDLKGGLSGIACNKCHAAYPHESGWATPSIHGPAAKGDLKLKNNCNLCHGDDWNGGNTRSSCLNCHKGSYPHPQGWASPDQHGAFASQNGAGKCATQCHGLQLDGGLSGVGCKSCHAVWPHPKTSDWFPVHGETARNIGLNGCLGCHKITPSGGTTGVACDSCHNSLPSHSTSGWGQSGHGQFVMQNPTSLTDSKGCMLCHGANFNGGKTPTSATLSPVRGCTDAACHASYPTLHKPAAGAAAWETYNGHGKWLMDQGAINTLLTPCKLCHGNDLKGGNTGKTCFNAKCHTSFPHDIDPATSPWLAKHGAIANGETQGGATQLSCATVNCHGTDLKGIPAEEKDLSKKQVLGCADCHMQMPHQATWPKTHGASAAVNPNNCTTCHGSNWTGSTTSPSCYTCHGNFPLPHRKADGSKDPQWKTAAGHGTLVMAATGATAKDKAVTLKCTTCHGDTLSGGSSGVSCYKCHTSFPHAPLTSLTLSVGGTPTAYTFTDSSWGDFDKGHGRYVSIQAKLNNVAIKQQIQNDCATQCHGTDLLGGQSGISCYQCHNVYPHPAGDAWAKAYNATDTPPGGPHALTALQKGAANSCLTNCHGSNAAGDFKGDNKCSTCHSFYPHLPGWKDDHSKNAEYSPHALAVLSTQNTANKNDDTFNAAVFNECAKCHGPALDFTKTETYPLIAGDKTTVTPAPGITVKRCTSCHIYPHQKIQSSNFSLINWINGHGVPLFYWNTTSEYTIPENSCGSAEGKSGCHTTGPGYTFDPTQPPGPKNPNMGDQPGCNYCHK